MRNSKKKPERNRYSVLIVIMTILFGTIVCRLIYLQIYKYDDFKDRANTRATRFIADKAPRGKIYDSQGNILATNKQTYTVTFTETDESKKEFYKTMDKVVGILKDNSEKLQDNFKIKLDANNKPYFDFATDNDDVRKAQEIRFKKDRGLNEVIQKKLYPKKKDAVTDEEEAKINEELLKLNAEDTFEYLVKSYSLYDALELKKAEVKQYSEMTSKEITEKLLKKYSMEQLRDYMLVKDAIKIQSFSGFKPVSIAGDIKEDSAFVFYQKLNDLSGINVSMEPMRDYPYKDLASGILGYVSSINSSNKNLYEERGYDLSSDIIGKAGIESAFETTLKGSKGGNTVKVNAAGRKVEDLFQLQTSPGNNVHLSIDKDIQYSAETMLQNQLNYLQSLGSQDGIDFRNATRGAAVAIEVKTGRVLAMVSLPKYDPNIFATGQITPEISKKYFAPDLEAFGNSLIKYRGLSATVDDLFPKNKSGQRQDTYDLYPKPFFNYATMGLIPPGSTFKPLTSVAALEEGVTTPDTWIMDGSNYDKHPDIFGKPGPRDSKPGGHGGVDLKKALAVSCNYYYYDAGINMYYNTKGSGDEPADKVRGLNVLSKYAWAMGLGTDPKSSTKASTGIEISENFGNSYNFDAYKELSITYGKWHLRDYLKAGIFPSRGTRFTPLDINSVSDDKTDKLEVAKTNLKDLVVNKLNEIGVKEVKSTYDSFYKDVRNAMQDIYDNSDEYKKAIESSNKNSKSELDVVSQEIATWTIYSMSIEMMTPVELANASIGQGMNNFTPLQIADYIATLANGGTRYKAHLVDKVTDPNGKIVEEYKSEVISQMDIKPENLAAIKEGMRMANTSQGDIYGTASSVFANFPIPSGGKTGTATWKENQEAVGRADYGVYVSFAPLDNPEIAVCVSIYDGGHGYFGAPVARAIYETYWRDKFKNEYPNYQPKDMGGNKYDYSLKPPTKNEKDSK